MQFYLYFQYFLISQLSYISALPCPEALCNVPIQLKRNDSICPSASRNRPPQVWSCRKPPSSGPCAPLSAALFSKRPPQFTPAPTHR